ncbi:hypothetical protein J2W15_004069 [Pseudarthrobacter sulfonivorans]|nr:hypothetical protein [Pseudarthrobacter sulfonivorans]
MAEVIERRHGRRRSPTPVKRGFPRVALLSLVLLVGVAIIAFALTR